LHKSFAKKIGVGPETNETNETWLMDVPVFT